ncbi:class I SAM-dependent methyltransferase [Citrifermentans bremense]|uniref:class I SAM-dependent methyltransferase n=1 Tax=Citrifermentans bremense TaxID=60035 RepID=UPI000409FDF1|nr:class I SAM-dependent methyltransferase [Citrifermentans bremense]
MLPYQNDTVQKVMRLLPRGTRDILEIGSDIGGEVACALAELSGARVVGINPSESFPAPAGELPSNVSLLRADGRALPFGECSFDVVFAVATMEHVQGLDLFLSEVERVLRPGGVFHTEFSPIWSSARGHHVFAVVGNKEARFWKPGKNPIPDYAHLLWGADEMRDYLRSGPTTEELIEPIVQWVYFDDSLNRCHLEEYLAAFDRSPLLMQKIRFDCDPPAPASLAQLAAKYGAGRRFGCHSISTELRKRPVGGMAKAAFTVYLALCRQIVPRAQRVRLLLYKVYHALRSICHGA